VQCSANADCPAARPRCLYPDGSCVQCLDNIDCGAAQPICDPDGFVCRAGCTSNAQCNGSTPLCNTTASS
jgi:hypothetical protein